MIDERITLAQVDEIYQLAGLHELFILPWFEEGRLAGLITGYIDEIAPFPGKTAWLQHFIVLPDAADKLKIMQQMPKTAHALAALRGCDQVILSIAVSDPRARQLGIWARRCRYTYVGVRDEHTWYVKYLREEDGQEHPETSGSRSAAAAAPAPAAGS